MSDIGKVYLPGSDNFPYNIIQYNIILTKKKGLKPVASALF